MRTAWITLLATACHDVPRHDATVQLEIDGQRHDYTTSAAEWERIGDGPVSVYLIPDDPRSGQPYVNLRFYSGNPVGHFWMRYTTDEAEFEHPPKWECFVPGRLRDGTDTLTWKREDGSDRHNTETGEAGCTAGVEVLSDGGVELDFDVLLRPKDKKKKEGDDGEEITLRARGKAVVEPG